MSKDSFSASTRIILYFITSALVLPSYDFFIGIVLGRTEIFGVSDPFSVIISFISSLCFFIFLEKILENKMYFTAIILCLSALALPVVYMQIPVQFGDRPLIYITPTILGVLVAFLESFYRKNWREIEIEDWKTERSVQIGILHSILAIEMYVINRGINFTHLASELARTGTLWSYLFVIIRQLIVIPLNFIIAAAPIYFYQKKKLKTPLAVFFTWFSIGAILFILKWDEYPVSLLSGGIGIFPPQPDYLLRPWLPLILIIVSWKLEESYRGEKEDSA